MSKRPCAPSSPSMGLKRLSGASCKAGSEDTASLGGYNTAINVIIAALMALIGLLFFTWPSPRKHALADGRVGRSFLADHHVHADLCRLFHPLELKSEARLADGLDGTVRRFLHRIYSEGVIRV